jgi:hemoglobin
MKKVGAQYIITVTILILLFCLPNFAQETDQVKEESLYNKLGGSHAIAQVVDDFVERIWVNEVLNANPMNKEAMGISKPALKYLATELTCMATGGPQKYSGRGMKEVHSGLNISEKEWDAMVVDFKTTLNKFDVHEKEQSELIQLVGGLKGDIVMSSVK